MMSKAFHHTDSRAPSGCSDNININIGFGNERAVEYLDEWRFEFRREVC
jgi:hypothetical protein